MVNKPKRIRRWPRFQKLGPIKPPPPDRDVHIQIWKLKAAGMTGRRIAEIVGLNPSNVTRRLQLMEQRRQLWTSGRVIGVPPKHGKDRAYEIFMIHYKNGTTEVRKWGFFRLWREMFVQQNILNFHPVSKNCHYCYVKGETKNGYS